jgi:hypothetical protein
MSDHETSLDLAISILVLLNPCIDHVIHLTRRALRVSEESGHELDGCAVEYTFTEDTVIVHARINGSAEKAFAWIHEDPAGHHKRPASSTGCKPNLASIKYERVNPQSTHFDHINNS